YTPFEPLGLSIGGISPSNRTIPYAMNYNLTLERELPGQVILSIGYVGANGRKLIISKGLQAATPQGIATCLATPACAGNPSAAPGNFPSMYPLDPNVWGIPGFQYNGGESNFNSLQVTVDKHLTHGLTLRGTYAYAHSLDTTSSFEDLSFNLAGNVDPYGNLRRDYGDSAFDVRHRGVISWVYEIPSLSKVVSGLPDRIFGGWRISGINSLQTGIPVFFQDARNRSLTCSFFFSYYGCPDRPDVVTVPTPTDPHSQTFGTKTTYFFNPADFTNNALGTEGDARRGILHGPSFWDLDFSLAKDTKITERTTITLSADAFNLFNHTNFGQP